MLFSLRWFLFCIDDVCRGFVLLSHTRPRFVFFFFPSASEETLGGLLSAPRRSCIQARGHGDHYFGMCLGHRFHLLLFLRQVDFAVFSTNVISPEAAWLQHEGDESPPGSWISLSWSMPPQLLLPLNLLLVSFLPVITGVGQLLPELFLCWKERFL